MRGSITMVYIHMCVWMDMAMLFGLRWRGAPHLVLSSTARESATNWVAKLALDTWREETPYNFS